MSGASPCDERSKRMREVKRSVEQVSVRALLELRTRMGEPRSRMGASQKQPYTSLEAAAKVVFCALALVEEDTAEGLALARGKLSKHSWERVLRALAVPGDFLNLLRRLPASMDGRWTERVEFIRHVLATPETSPMTVETQLRRWFEALLTLGELPLATDPSPECKRSLQDALEAVQTSLAKPAVSETEVKDQTEKLDVQEVRMRPTPQKAARSPLRDMEGRRAGKSRQTPGPKGEDTRRVSSPGGVSPEPRFVGSEGRRRSDPAPKPVKGDTLPSSVSVWPSLLLRLFPSSKDRQSLLCFPDILYKYVSLSVVLSHMRASATSIAQHDRRAKVADRIFFLSPCSIQLLPTLISTSSPHSLQSPLTSSTYTKSSISSFFVSSCPQCGMEIVSSFKGSHANVLLVSSTRTDIPCDMEGNTYWMIVFNANCFFFLLFTSSPPHPLHIHSFCVSLCYRLCVPGVLCMWSGRGRREEGGKVAVVWRRCVCIGLRIQWRCVESLTPQ